MKYFLFILLVFTVEVFASPLDLNRINVECINSSICGQRKAKFEGLAGAYRSLLHLKETLRIIASDGGYSSFSYHLKKENGVYVLFIKFDLKPVIEKINVHYSDRKPEMDLLRLFTIKEQDFYEPLKFKDNLESLQRKLEGMGYPHNSQKFEIIEKGDKVNVKLIIALGPPRIFKKIKSNTTSSFVNGFLIRKFNHLYNKPFDFNKFKVYLDEAQKELFTYGYYLLDLDFAPLVKGNRVILDIKVSNDKLFAFDIKGKNSDSRTVLINLITDLYKQYKRSLSESTIRNALQEYYKKRALLNVDISIYKSNYQNKFKESVELTRIEIEEGEKTRLSKVNFLGNSFFLDDKLQRMFAKESFELASINYYDDDYFEFFSEYLRNEYLKNGFVQVRINGPIKVLDKDKKLAEISYHITEGTRALIRGIKFSGIPEIYEELILGQIVNKIGRPFNPNQFTEDLKRISTLLQEKGYYFAEIANINDPNIVKYSKFGSEVDINISVNAGPIICLNRILYLGNNKTRKKVLLKRIFLKQGDLITPSKVRDIESAISSTGLFNSVVVTPVQHTSKKTTTDLIVKVVEREYGLLEVAPGFRTDIGLKLSTTLSYQNIGGIYQSAVLKAQINQRLDYQTFDPRRRSEKKQLVEYNTSFNYNFNDIFDSSIDAGLGVSVQRKRFYSFDADIFRSNVTLTRELSRKLSSSVRYQYERITQSDATELRDNGSFVIGAITPSLTYDLRNSQINPVSGSFFNLSCEFANPYFLSQKTTDLTVNYYKLISRNRFYVPFKNGTVAISLVGGVQENLAKDVVTDSNGQVIVEDGQKRTEGYIPNIKVFRLTGMDIVRGFTDQEINALPNTDDISQVRIQNRAYLTNLKLEPRYFLTDNIIGGVFYDAGRVSVDRIDLGELRDSVGVTFKFLTPVGTLDFDYGIKLLRKRTSSGNLEDPGRFHVSIGFF